MVSYFNSSLNPTTMYRNNQQTITPSNGQFPPPPPPPPPPNSSWYTPINYHHHHQTNQSSSIHPGYNALQEDQQFRQHHHPCHHHHHHHHPGYHHQLTEFHTSIQQLPVRHNYQEHHIIDEHQLPSPSMTIVGSDISSPGNITENTVLNQDHPIRSPTTKTTSTPYEWINKSSQHKQAEPGKTRTKDKYRVVYTDHQRVELEKEFYYSRYITMRRKTELANNLGLSERQVKIWFQNRRAKERKQVKKCDEMIMNQNDNNTIINTIHNIL